MKHVAGDRAYYRMSEDKIVLPEWEQFLTANAYYQTVLHELGHATGHPERMDRDSLKEGLDKGFGSPEYAREELRAQISAMMTGERVGVGHDPQRGTAYVENWVKVLEEDPREIHRAAGEAQRMSDYLVGRIHTREAPGKEQKDDLTRKYSPAQEDGQRALISVPAIPVLRKDPAVSDRSQPDGLGHFPSSERPGRGHGLSMIEHCASGKSTGAIWLDGAGSGVDRPGVPSQRRLHAGAVLFLLQHQPNERTAIRETAGGSRGSGRTCLANLFRGS